MSIKDDIDIHIENYDEEWNGHGTATVGDEEYGFSFGHNSAKLIFSKGIDEELAGEIQAFYNAELEREAKCIAEIEYDEYLEGEGKVQVSGIVEDWVPIMCLGAGMYATHFAGVFRHHKQNL